MPERPPNPIDVRLPEQPLSIEQLRDAVTRIRSAYTGETSLPGPLWTLTQSQMRNVGGRYALTEIPPERRLPNLPELNLDVSATTRWFVESEENHVRTLLELASQRATFERAQAWAHAQTMDAQQLMSIRSTLEQRAMDLGRIRSVNEYMDALHIGFLRTADRYIAFCSTPAGAELRRQRLASDPSFRQFETRLAGMLTEFEHLMPLMVKLVRLRLMEVHLKDDEVARNVEQLASTLPAKIIYNNREMSTADVPIGYLFDQDQRRPAGEQNQVLRTLIALDPSIREYTIAQTCVTFRRLDAVLSGDMIKRLADSALGNVREGLKRRIYAMRTDIEGDSGRLAGILPSTDASGAKQPERENRERLKNRRFVRNASTAETRQYSMDVQKRLLDLFRIGEDAGGRGPTRLIDSQFIVMATAQRDALVSQLRNSSQPSVAKVQELFALYQQVTDMAMDHLQDMTGSATAMLGVLTHEGQIGPDTRMSELPNPRDLQPVPALARTASVLPEVARGDVDREHAIYAEGLRGYCQDVRSAVESNSRIVSEVRTMLLNFCQPVLELLKSWLATGNNIAWWVPNHTFVGPWAKKFIQQRFGQEWAVDTDALRTELSRWVQNIESIPDVTDRFNQRADPSIGLITTSVNHLEQIHEHVPVQDLSLEEGEAYFELFHGQFVRNPVVRTGRSPAELQQAYDEASRRSTAELLRFGEDVLTKDVAEEFAELFRRFYRAEKNMAAYDQLNGPIDSPDRTRIVGEMIAARSQLMQFRVRHFYLLQLVLGGVNAPVADREARLRMVEEYKQLLVERKNARTALERAPDNDAEQIRQALINYLDAATRVSELETQLRETLVGRLESYKERSEALRADPSNAALQAQVRAMRATAMLLSERTVADIEQVHAPLLHLRTRELLQDLNAKVKGHAMQINDMLLIKSLVLSILSGAAITVTEYVTLAETFGRFGRYGGVWGRAGRIGLLGRNPLLRQLTRGRYNPLAIINGVTRPGTWAWDRMRGRHEAAGAAEAAAGTVREVTLPANLQQAISSFRDVQRELADLRATGRTPERLPILEAESERLQSQIMETLNEAEAARPAAEAITLRGNAAEALVGRPLSAAERSVVQAMHEAGESEFAALCRELGQDPSWVARATREEISLARGINSDQVQRLLQAKQQRIAAKSRVFRDAVDAGRWRVPPTSSATAELDLLARSGATGNSAVIEEPPVTGRVRSAAAPAEAPRPSARAPARPARTAGETPRSPGRVGGVASAESAEARAAGEAFTAERAGRFKINAPQLRSVGARSLNGAVRVLGGIGVYFEGRETVGAYREMQEEVRRLETVQQQMIAELDALTTGPSPLLTVTGEGSQKVYTLNGVPGVTLSVGQIVNLHNVTDAQINGWLQTGRRGAATIFFAAATVGAVSGGVALAAVPVIIAVDVGINFAKNSIAAQKRRQMLEQAPAWLLSYLGTVGVLGMTADQAFEENAGLSLLDFGPGSWTEAGLMVNPLTGPVAVGRRVLRAGDVSDAKKANREKLLAIMAYNSAFRVSHGDIIRGLPNLGDPHTLLNLEGQFLRKGGDFERIVRRFAVLRLVEKKRRMLVGELGLGGKDLMRAVKLKDVETLDPESRFTRAAKSWEDRYLFSLEEREEALREGMMFYVQHLRELRYKEQRSAIVAKIAGDPEKQRQALEAFDTEVAANKDLWFVFDQHPKDLPTAGSPETYAVKLLDESEKTVDNPENPLGAGRRDRAEHDALLRGAESVSGKESEIVRPPTDAERLLLEVPSDLHVYRSGDVLPDKRLYVGKMFTGWLRHQEGDLVIFDFRHPVQGDGGPLIVTVTSFTASGRDRSTWEITEKRDEYFDWGRRRNQVDRKNSNERVIRYADWTQKHDGQAAALEAEFRRLEGLGEHRDEQHKPAEDYEKMLRGSESLPHNEKEKRILDYAKSHPGLWFRYVNKPLEAGEKRQQYDYVAFVPKSNDKPACFLYLKSPRPADLQVGAPGTVKQSDEDLHPTIITVMPEGKDGYVYEVWGNYRQTYDTNPDRSLISEGLGFPIVGDAPGSIRKVLAPYVRSIGSPESNEMEQAALEYYRTLPVGDVPGGGAVPKREHFLRSLDTHLSRNARIEGEPQSYRYLELKKFYEALEGVRKEVKR